MYNNSKNIQIFKYSKTNESNYKKKVGLLLIIHNKTSVLIYGKWEKKNILIKTTWLNIFYNKNLLVKYH